MSRVRPRIGVVDYGMGNRRSVQKALEHVGAEAPITSEQSMLESCAGLVVPGVGAFPRAMTNLLSRGLDDHIRRRAELQTPVLGICLGQALDQALGDRAGIVRFGQATVPMDESRAGCAIDISGRGLLWFEGALPPGAIGNFDHELASEFFRALATNGRLTMHLTIEAGSNVHHMIEAMFKAAARALATAAALDPREPGIPSTKGTLT